MAIVLIAPEIEPRLEEGQALGDLFKLCSSETPVGISQARWKWAVHRERTSHDHVYILSTVYGIRYLYWTADSIESLVTPPMMKEPMFAAQLSDDVVAWALCCLGQLQQLEGRSWTSGVELVMHTPSWINFVLSLVFERFDIKVQMHKPTGMMSLYKS